MASVTRISNLTRVTAIQPEDIIPFGPQSGDSARGSTKTNFSRQPVYSVSELPVGVEGDTAYVSNGAAGDPVLAFHDGASWLRCDTLAVVSIS